MKIWNSPQRVLSLLYVFVLPQDTVVCDASVNLIKQRNLWNDNFDLSDLSDLWRNENDTTAVAAVWLKKRNHFSSTEALSPLKSLLSLGSNSAHVIPSSSSTKKVMFLLSEDPATAYYWHTVCIRKLLYFWHYFLNTVFHINKDVDFIQILQIGIKTCSLNDGVSYTHQDTRGTDELDRNLICVPKDI